MARDRRLILLEVFVALLILLEVVMGLIKLTWGPDKERRAEKPEPVLER